jgi:beta-glucuronidase
VLLRIGGAMEQETMLRTFSEHRVRPVSSLDGIWDFAIDGDRRGSKGRPSTYGRKILVPSAWEQIPGLENHRGRGWLRTRLRGGGQDVALRLVFGGVSHTGVVYVDGRKRGRHYDAFTPWDVLVPGLSQGEHEVVVEVDNSFGPHSALHIENDYYTYGGITRPVEAQWVSPVFIEKVFATPRQNRSTWDLDVRVRLRNWSASKQAIRLVLTLGDCRLDAGEVTLRPRSTMEVSCTLSKLGVKPWSGESPTLYSLVAELVDSEGEVVDDLVDRVGFREVKVRGRKLLLNREPLRLRGYNRHEDHGQFANALPVAAMMSDLQILRDLGCNFVRTCHYPNDLRFLDLCDELGFYVWEESHARAVDFAHPKFREQIADSTREMVEWHHNRPSIVMWGCLNECASDTASGKREHERVLKLLKTLDPSRPTTFASNKGRNDLCLGLVDIVSWNRYPAWYGGTLEDIRKQNREMMEWLHSDASRGGKGKPVILSEFGAGAIPGCRNRNRAHWTEEYQCDVLDESLRVYLNEPGIVGAAIWQFTDCRVTGRWWSGRPRTMNNKGTVDEYRRPKLAYDVVRRRMREAAERFR